MRRARQIVEFCDAHVVGVAALFDRLSEEDRTFVKGDTAPTTVATWPHEPGWRWIACDAAGIVRTFCALIPLTGWSDHVAEIRLVVDPAARGQGLGKAMARTALKKAVSTRIRKVVVELPAVQEPSIEMFVRLGFTGEALLRDHFRDRAGNLRDLVMLAYLTDEAFEQMAAVGAVDALEELIRGGDDGGALC